MSGPAVSGPAAGRPVRVLVTGASGFVGGALLERLVGDDVFSAVGIGRRALPGRAGYHVLDLAAPDAATRLDHLQADGAGATTPAAGAAMRFVPDVVVHAAARSSPWGSRAEFERENVGITRALLAWAGALPEPPRIVFVSTASVLYRARDQVGVRGDLPARGPFVGEYARSKAAAEGLVRGYRGEWVILRPRAVFGPGDTTVFPRLLAAARSGRLPRLKDPRGGAVVSDLVHIESLVAAIVRAATEAAPVGRTAVVTGGEPVQLQRAVFGILQRMGVPEPRRSVSRRTALVAAGAVELLWRLGRRGGEPPITRYSVIVYAFSKTFDPAEGLRLFGEPEVRTAEGLERLVAELAEHR